MSKGLCLRTGWLWNHPWLFSLTPPIQALRLSCGPYSNAVTSHHHRCCSLSHTISYLHSAIASSSISLFPPFPLQSVFQHRGWSDPWISKQSQTLQWSVLLRVKTEVLITAYKRISYFYDFFPFSFLPQVFYTSPTGLLASWTYEVAFYLKVFTWAILLAWNACSLDTLKVRFPPSSSHLLSEASPATVFNIATYSPSSTPAFSIPVTWSTIFPCYLSSSTIFIIISTVLLVSALHLLSPSQT